MTRLNGKELTKKQSDKVEVAIKGIVELPRQEEKIVAILGSMKKVQENLGKAFQDLKSLKSIYPDKSLNEAQEGYIHLIEKEVANILYQATKAMTHINNI